MKKVSLITSILILLIGSSLRPFSLHADVSGFDYTNFYELNYIESTGTQYIDTGVTPAVTFQVDIWVSSSVNGFSDDVLMGTGNDNGSSFRSETYLNASNQMRFYSSAGSTTNSTVLSLNTKYKVSYIQNSSVLNGRIDDNSSYANLSGVTSVNKLYLLSYYNGATRSYGKFRVYQCNVYNNGSLVRSFYPAERKSDNAIGLYDTTNGVFYPNSGTGSFVSGGRMVTQYVISTNVSPSGSGSVSGAGTYDSGDSVTLTATASNGYTFDHWSDGSTVNPLVTTATSDVTYTAYFVANPSPPVNQYVISTDVSPSGSGTVTGGGTYDSGSVITLTAAANNGYVFDRWSDGNTTNPRSVTVSSSATYTAVFVENVQPSTQYTVSAIVSPSNSGTVSGTGTYQAGTSVTLTAVANSGYVFSTWSDGINANPRTFNISSNINLTAYFVQDVSENKIIGGNINIIDLDSYSSDIHGGSSSVPQIVGYTAHITSPYDHDNYFLYFQDLYIGHNTNYLYQLDTILSDDYIGYVVVSSNIFTTSRTVYVNGNHFTLNYYFTNGDYGGSIQFNYDTTNLVKKDSVVSLIDNGTPESNQSESSLDDATSSANDSFNEAIGIENDFSDQMNEALDDIDTGFDPSSMGSKFQTSAIWVSQQFDRMTSNTPFGSVLGFSLVLGLGLLIIGRVL